MAIVVTSLGTAQSKTGGAILSGLTFTQGDVIVCVAASDAGWLVNLFFRAQNSGATRQQIKAAPDVTATNAGNVVTSIGYLVIDADASSYDRLACYPATNGDSIAAAFYRVTGLAASPIDKSATSTGTGTSPSSGATATLTQADELIIGAIGTEGPDGDVAGSWTTGTSNVSGNEQRLGTTGGGAAGNITISSAAEVVSATTAATGRR
jgi:hypothetical protein